jgi:hypothetical protein
MRYIPRWILCSLAAYAVYALFVYVMAFTFGTARAYEWAAVMMLRGIYGLLTGLALGAAIGWLIARRSKKS